MDLPLILRTVWLTAASNGCRWLTSLTVGFSQAIYFLVKHFTLWSFISMRGNNKWIFLLLHWTKSGIFYTIPSKPALEAAINLVAQEREFDQKSRCFFDFTFRSSQDTCLSFIFFFTIQSLSISDFLFFLQREHHWLTLLTIPVLVVN